MTVITLYKQGISQRKIAKLVGHDRKTIRKIIKKYEKDGIKEPMEIRRGCVLDEHKEKIVELLEKDLSGVRIQEELIREGVKVGYSTIARYIENIKSKKDVCIRFHTEAGEEAQVDFGYAGLLPIGNGKKRKAWIFNMRLSYSRLDYYEIVYDQKVSTFLRCHIKAFRDFGGVPKIVKIDNLKAGILEANFYEPIYQREYKALSEYYGYEIIPCRVRQPQEKGKVESGIKYVKNNFLKGREFKDLKDAESKLEYWVKNICNKRVHGTTKKIPEELYEKEEKRELKELPIKEYCINILSKRKVCKDCHIVVENNYYSVPYKYVGKFVEVHIKANIINILHEGREIAVHEKAKGEGKFVTNKEHYNQHKVFDLKCDKFRSKYKDKMEEIGENAKKLYVEILLKKPNNWYRTATGILALKKTYKEEVVDQACKRALVFGITDYSKVKNICKTGSYNLPIEMEVANARAC